MLTPKFFSAYISLFVKIQAFAESCIGTYYVSQIRCYLVFLLLEALWFLNIYLYDIIFVVDHGNQGLTNFLKKGSAWTFMHAKLHIHKTVTVGANLYPLIYNLLIGIVFPICFGFS